MKKARQLSLKVKPFLICGGKLREQQRCEYDMSCVQISTPESTATPLPLIMPTHSPLLRGSDPRKWIGTPNARSWLAIDYTHYFHLHPRKDPRRGKKQPWRGNVFTVSPAIALRPCSRIRTPSLSRHFPNIRPENTFHTYTNTPYGTRLELLLKG